MRPALLLPMVLAAAAVPSRAAAPPELVVLKIKGDSVQLKSNEDIVALFPGSRGFSVPSGSLTTVLSGELWLLLGDHGLRADAGDSFLFNASDGGAQVFVSAGTLDVTEPSGAARLLGAGQTLQAGGSAAAAAPAEAAAPATTPVPAPPAVPAGWDPLNALARSMSALASFRQPDLRLVLELHPFYTISQTYDSNIYLVPPDKADGSRVGGGVIGSWITTNNLGARLLMPINRRHKLDGQYGLDWIDYYKQPKTNNAVNQRAGLAYSYTGIRDAVARFYDNYVNTEDPAFSELTARERRFQNSLGGSVEVSRHRHLALTADAQHITHKYLNPGLAAILNRYEIVAGGTVGLKLQPRTRLYAGYHRGIIHYSAGRSAGSKSHMIDVGIDGVLTRRLTGRLQGGYQFRRYDTASTSSEGSAKSVLTSVQLAYKATDRNDVNLRFFRDVNESTFGVSRYYIATGTTLSATHAFRRLSVAANGSFQIDKYPEATTLGGITANRRDDLYGAGLSADYKARSWLSLGAAYQRLQRHSSFTDQFNYKDDRTTLSMKVSF